MTEKAVITTVTRTVTVDFDQNHIRDLLRKECGAPSTATVELESWGDATVTWSTTEQSPLAPTKRTA